MTSRGVNLAGPPAVTSKADGASARLAGGAGPERVAVAQERLVINCEESGLYQPPEDQGHKHAYCLPPRLADGLYAPAQANQRRQSLFPSMGRVTDEPLPEVGRSRCKSAATKYRFRLRAPSAATPERRRARGRQAQIHDETLEEGPVRTSLDPYHTVNRP